ncbi:hypothetical protein Barb4_05507 [Bacteroidales bacterium Barb4]|nr:hypothetical protein Barb4_05507 [Bacteroidales bacterium Barb4]
MNLFNASIPFPLVETVINQLPVRKILGKHAPLTACFKHAEDGINYFSQRVFPLAFVF